MPHILSKQTITKEKQIITEKVVEFCAKDVRPFEIIIGLGFRNLAQYLISIGARYGEINVEDILPHPTTVSRHVADVKNKKQNEIFPVIQQAIKDGECGLTTDGWTDDYKKNYYLTMTSHYFDHNFILRKNVLFTSLFNADRKTGVKIRNEITRRFELFGFDAQDLRTIPIVTDAGSNVVKAFKGNYRRKKCYAHIINTVLRNTFKKHAPIRIEIIIESCKKIVRYIKQSAKNNKLKHAVIQEVETRWNSKLEMIRSVVMQYDEIMALLSPSQRAECSFNIDLAKELVRFLVPFKEATDELEGENYPTSNKILLWRIDLMEHIEKGNFVGSMKTVAKYAAQYMNLKFPILMEHKVACFLDPRYRSLNMLPENERSEVFAEVRNLMEGVPDLNQGDISPPKKPRYSMYEENIDDRNSNEIDTYIKTADYGRSKTNKHIVETFWKTNENKFPKLHRLARSMLCVPATSASSERMFSCSGRTIDTRRTNLNPETLDNLLFIRDTFPNTT